MRQVWTALRQDRGNTANAQYLCHYASMQQDLPVNQASREGSILHITEGAHICGKVLMVCLAGGLDRSRGLRLHSISAEVRPQRLQPAKEERHSYK